MVFTNNSHLVIIKSILKMPRQVSPFTALSPECPITALSPECPLTPLSPQVSSHSTFP